MSSTEPVSQDQNTDPTSDRCSLLRRRLFARALSPTKANLCRFAIAFPFAIIAVVAVVLHSALPPMILAGIGDSLNADVRATSWQIGLDEVVLNGVTVRSRTVDGSPGEVIQIERLKAEILPNKLFNGVGAVKELHLEQPTFRVSFDTESVDRPKTNLAGLRLPASDGAGASGNALPAITITGGAIDWGEHTGDRFRRLKLLRVDGALRPVMDSGEPKLELVLHEVLSATGRQADGDGIIVTGEVAPEKFSLTLKDFDVRAWLPRAAPSAVRPLLADLDIAGNVSEITLELSGAQLERASAIAELDGVAVTLPLAQEGQSDEELRLSDTSGRLRLEQRQLLAEVTGELAGVPYTVEFDADVRDLLEGRGVEANMPYAATVTVDDFRLNAESNFLPFLPDAVRDVLARFADQNQIGAISPTASVSAEVRLAGRIAGSADGFGAAVPETYRGVVQIQGGATAFYEFPYQFEDMRGEIEFDQNRLVIRSLFGTAPTGALISASGVVSPLGAAAGFDLEIEVFDVPLDSTFRAAMKPEHQSALEQILSRDEYAELVARVLVVPPGQRGLVTEALEQSRAMLQAMADSGDAAAGATLAEVGRMIKRGTYSPEVELGGQLGLLLDLTKPKGGQGRWSIDIHADIADATLVPEQFPLPIRVRDLAVRISDDVATITRGSAVPINGLSGFVEGTVDLSGPKSKPNLLFRADRMRTGELLNYAIGPVHRDPARVAAADTVRAIGLHGDTDAIGRVQASEDGDLEFAVSMGLDRISVLTEPLRGHPPLMLGDAGGVLELTHAGLQLETNALFTDISGSSGIETPATVQVAIDLDWSDPESELVSRSVIGIQGAPMTAPFEQMLSVFNQEAGQALVELRQTFDPHGRGDAEVIVQTDASGASRSTAEILGLTDVSVTQFGGRIETEAVEGGIVVHGRTDGRSHVVLDDLRGDLSFGGEPAGSFLADGAMELSEPDGQMRRRELHATFTGGRFESPIARAFVTTQIGGRFAEDYLSHDARGAFDLDAFIEPRVALPDSFTKPGLEEIARPTYTLRPRWGEIFRRGRDVRVEVVEGEIVTVPGRTRIDGIRAEGDGFSVAANGSLTPDGFGGAALDVEIDLDAASLTPDLQALLVDEINANVEKLEFESPGRITMDGGRLRVSTGPGATGNFEGLLAFENASAVLGSPVDQVAGTVRVSSSRRVEDPAPDLLLLAHAERARMAGLEMRDVRVRVEGEADRPGWLDVPVFSAAGRAGGRIWGKGALLPTEDPEAPEYEFAASFTGLSLAAMQDELEAFGLTLDGADELNEPREETGALMQGRLALAGTVEQDHTRRGLLSLRVAGGELLRVPVLGRLIEVKALQPPTGEAIDFAQADLTVNGNVITADYLSVQSRTVEVFGTGLITLPDFDLDLVLYTRSISPWPVVSKFADALFDEVGRVAVTGTAKEPRPSIVTFPTGRRLLGSILSADPWTGSTRLDAVERRALHLREVRDRYREVKQPARPATITSRPARQQGRVAGIEEKR